MNYALGYYGNNGKIMETTIFNNEKDFIKEVSESSEIGRPIKIIIEKDYKSVIHSIYKSEKETMLSCAKRLEKLKESEYELER